MLFSVHHPLWLARTVPANGCVRRCDDRWFRICHVSFDLYWWRGAAKKIFNADGFFKIIFRRLRADSSFRWNAYSLGVSTLALTGSTRDEEFDFDIDTDSDFVQQPHRSAEDGAMATSFYVIPGSTAADAICNEVFPGLSHRIIAFFACVLLLRQATLFASLQMRTRGSGAYAQQDKWLWYLVLRSGQPVCPARRLRALSARRRSGVLRYPRVSLLVFPANDPPG